MIEWLGNIAVFCLGAIIGSFLNVVILRYPYSTSNLNGRSHCPACQATLRWWQLVPIFSYLLLRGRCFNCKKSISIQYPLVEILAGLLFLTVVWQWPLSMGDWYVAVLKMIILSLLLVVSIIDLKTFLLPDAYLIMIAAAGLLFVAAQDSYLDHLYGLLAGGGFILFLYVITRGQGIGFGDVKLAALLGALVGLGGAITFLALAFMIGGAVGIFLLARQRATLKTAIPFGPFLTASAALVLLQPALPQILLTFLLGG